MAETDILRSLGLPIESGLVGFIEPRSIGSTLILVNTLEGKIASSERTQVGTFMTVRALSMGPLGLFAVAAGSAFLGFQKAAWIIFAVAYALIGSDISPSGVAGIRSGACPNRWRHTTRMPNALAENASRAFEDRKQMRDGASSRRSHARP